jgi:hypothetical protein
MDEQPTVPPPEILPQASQPANYGVVQPPATAANTPPVKKPFLPNIPPLVYIGVVLFAIVFGSLIFASQRKPNVTVAPTPTPGAATPTPTSTRALTTFATQSAFMQYETTINGLPGIIQGAALQDPTIVPPVLDLPLGFSN